jgi:diadenosine tetraphosphate (Ap4A) HIT family hydrolase
MTCELCATDGGTVLWRDATMRVVHVPDPDHPAFCRVILNRHVAEMTDLPPADRERVMGCVWAVERALRTLVAPAKINLASLGNMTPHLHWHVIARFADDPHFPNPVWGPRVRVGAARSLPGFGERLAALLQASPVG